MFIKSPPTRLDQALTTVAFALMLAGWAVAYASFVPADPVAHRTQVAEVVR